MCSISSLKCCLFFLISISSCCFWIISPICQDQLEQQPQPPMCYQALCDLQMAWVSVLSFMYLTKVRNRRRCCRNVLPICEGNVDKFSLSIFFSITCAFIIESFVQDSISFFGWGEYHATPCQKTYQTQLEEVISFRITSRPFQRESRSKSVLYLVFAIHFVSFFPHLCHLPVSLPPLTIQ